MSLQKLSTIIVPSAVSRWCFQLVGKLTKMITPNKLGDGLSPKRG